ncbi:aryl-alcohol dehydrogenase-like predicted oxidoreductase [Actinomycetospora succinea]|uniref:Aryl-alcohol dehydrogenase-like predicted oxidoreductase n=1 Tax=Actinomycetospora succinea TaxID=663603 RepID=A0A4R6VMJ1_9PSEU|nr:aldo/keto reductase [Actinomycetospora succinea]TDQ63162.1 aryl-alcohol dehydrogenase-like predicted oxidoreductase [Actinomycetospora succinea]
METTRLGKTDLQVSRIAFGTWQVSGEWGSYDADQAQRAIRHALDLGVNFFDTAQAYGFGQAEEVLANALRGELDRDRDSVVIATKGGINPGTDRPRDSRREWLRSGVESSLKAMKIDHIDLYQVHWPDTDTPFADTAGYLQELVDEGKIRHVGVSNYDADQMAAFDTKRPVETLQPPYHLFRRGIEDDVLPYVRRNDIGTLVYSPLGSGLLTGTLTTDSTFEDDDWRSQSSAFRGEDLRTNLEVVERLKSFAADKGCEVSQLAIAWVLAQEGIDVAIVGARSERNIERSLAAVDVRLTSDDLAEIEKITADGVQVGGAAPEGVA